MTFRKMLNKNKVVLGLSGGVDSTTAALILKEKGFEVTGLYFDIHDAAERGKADINSGCRAAEEAAEQLGIRFLYKNVSRQFSDIVINDFCGEYIKGHTPNPCIICNPAVKFKTLIDAADEEGAYYIATGHYADTCFDEDTGIWYIKRAANTKKDQSYMMYRLGQEVISRLLLPLNEVDNKEQVREIARKSDLKNADAKDSQEICFIDIDDNYKDYIKRRGYAVSKGNFVDCDGNILGGHHGIINYTVGQRKGLGIALGKPVFVTKIDSETNNITLGSNEDLFTCHVESERNILTGYDIAGSETPEGLDGMEVMAKIRYAADPASAVINILPGGKIKTEFKKPQRAVTPGQSIVFYKDDTVVGGGFII